MIELIVAAVIVFLLLVIAKGSALLSWQILVGIGAAAVTAGLAVGVVTGIGYHVALFRALSNLGVLKPGWWWKPTNYNDYVPAGERRRVMPWFYAGAASFFVTLLGCFLVMAGLLAM